MDSGKNLELLFRYASTQKFEAFDGLFSELETVLSYDDLVEARLMRAQIKLFASAPSLAEDLERAGRVFELRPRFPFLGSLWQADAPNRFIVYSKAPGALRGFLALLPGAEKKLAHWYGKPAGNAVRQIQCEIHYFLGEPGEALRLAEEPYGAALMKPMDAIYSRCLQFRCNLALGRAQQAEACMLDMIRLSKAHPQCLAPYKALRNWANLTTSWNGDSPRFYTDEHGKKLPVLEDRLESIRMGNAHTTPHEEPFVAYAQRHCDDAYTVRQYYMDLFHPMYWLSVGDHKQAESYFMGLYNIARASGMIMPFVECGEQILPLLQHVKNSGLECSREWLDGVSSMALRYEESLNGYKASNL